MVNNENLIKLISELQNKVELLENRIKNLENNKSNENNREIDLDMYINMLELTTEDLNMVLINNFSVFIKNFIKNNWEEFKQENSDKIIKNINKKLINIFTLESQKKDISLYINKVLLLEDKLYEKTYHVFKKYDK